MRGYAPVPVTDEERDDDALDTDALLDRGERLLADSARLIRRLDAALGRKPGVRRREDGDDEGDRGPSAADDR